MDMKRIRRVSCAAALSAALAGCCHTDVCSVHPDSTDWADVFDKTLSNADMPAGSWGYDADGWLTAKTGATLLTKKDYGPIVVDTVYVMDKDANSGLFLYDTDHPKHKFEVQIMDDTSGVFAKVEPYQRTGSVYGRCAASEIRSRPAGEENRLTVWCERSRIRVAVNGKIVVDTNLDAYTNAEVNPDGTKIPSYHKGFPALATIARHGRIGLQGIHNTTANVRFKYLRVKEL